MHNTLRVFLLIFFTSLFILPAMAQENDMGNKKLSLQLNENGSRYLSFSGFFQIWLRHTEMNPGTVINEEPVDRFTDLSIRRYRLKVAGMPLEKLYFAFQIGNNNINHQTVSEHAPKILDAHAEYRLAKFFHIGGGKSAWMGLSRYSMPSTSKQLMYDLIQVAIPTVNRDDDLLRMLSIYMKGQIGNLDYRIIFGQTSLTENSELKLNEANFASRKPNLVHSAYFKYMFFDPETNSHNWSAGTYHGKKRLLNLGVGYKYVPNNMWYLNGQGDTILTNEMLFAADLFYEQPLNKVKNTTYSLYAGYYNYDLGPGFIRNLGINQPATGNIDPTIVNGSGNAYPSAGTGQAAYVQTAFLAPKMGKKKHYSQLQPYAALLYANWEALDDAVISYDVGINWLLNSHLSKFSLNYQSRPVFQKTSTGNSRLLSRKGMFVLQYQLRIE